MSEPTPGQQAILGSIVAARPASANALERTDPGKAAVALDMVAEGCTYREIKDKLGLSLNTLTSLTMRHQQSLDVRRKELAHHNQEMLEMNRQVAKMKYAQLADDPEALSKVNVKDLAISHGIYQDKEMAARGEAKQVIEVRTGRPSLADAQRIIEDAKAKLRSESVEVLTTKVTEATSE